MYRSTYSSPRYSSEVTGQLHAPAALPPGKGPPVAIGLEAGWAPEPFWTTWRGENLTPTGTRTPNLRPSSPEPVAKPTVLSRPTRSSGTKYKSAKQVEEIASPQRPDRFQPHPVYYPEDLSLQ
jgi:hypothetical protein